MFTSGSIELKLKLMHWILGFDKIAHRKPWYLMARFARIDLQFRRIARFSRIASGFPNRTLRRPHSSYQRVVQGKCPLHFLNLNEHFFLEHFFLEHFCLDQFSVIQGKFYMQDSRTPRLVEHFWVPILGAACSNKLFVGTVRPSQNPFFANRVLGTKNEIANYRFEAIIRANCSQVTKIVFCKSILSIS